MTTWLTDMTSKAEQFITKLDNSAAETLKPINGSKNDKISLEFKDESVTYEEAKQVVSYEPKITFETSPKKKRNLGKGNKAIRKSYLIPDENSPAINPSQSSTLEDNGLILDNLQEPEKSNDSMIEIKNEDEKIIDELRKENCNLLSLNGNLKEEMEMTKAKLNAKINDLQKNLTSSQDIVTLSNERINELTREIAENRIKYLSIITSKEETISNLKTVQQGAKGIDQVQHSVDSIKIDDLKQRIAALMLESQRNRETINHLQLQQNQSQSHIKDIQHEKTLEMAQSEKIISTLRQEVENLNQDMKEYQEQVALEKSQLHEEYSRMSEERDQLRASLDELRLKIDQRNHSSDRSQTNSSHIDLDSVKKEKLSLETRVRELNEKILRTLDSESALLTENQALRIQLQSYKRKSPHHPDVNSDSATSQYENINSISGINCVRLNLGQYETQIPKSCYPIIDKVDSYIIYLGNILRRRPHVRLLFFAYLLILNVWFCFSSMLFTPRLDNSLPAS